MNFLSRLEELLLLAIWKLNDNAYGVTIREQIEKETKRKWLSGAIYAPLQRLHTNGYVISIKADASTDRGGRPRIYYKVTEKGLEKLITIQELTRSIWQEVPDLKGMQKNA
jgi:DNA-binding PadR family transcriptional regulator